MNKSYKGYRQYINAFNQISYDVILIKWNNKAQLYEVSTYDDISSIDVTYLQPDIFGQWAANLGSAKRKALMDSGLKSRDFKWEEI